MLFSEDRISHLSHLIVRRIRSLEGVKFLRPEEAVGVEAQAARVARPDVL